MNGMLLPTKKDQFRVFLVEIVLGRRREKNVRWCWRLRPWKKDKNRRSIYES